MSEYDRIASRLLNTDDAMVWAVEFCRAFDGRKVLMDDETQVDVGTMIGWFANAMQAGIYQYEQRRLKAAEELGQMNIFKEGDDVV